MIHIKIMQTYGFLGAKSTLPPVIWAMCEYTPRGSKVYKYPLWFVKCAHNPQSVHIDAKCNGKTLKVRYTLNFSHDSCSFYLINPFHVQKVGSQPLILYRLTSTTTTLNSGKSKNKSLLFEWKLLWSKVFNLNLSFISTRKKNWLIDVQLSWFFTKMLYPMSSTI